MDNFYEFVRILLYPFGAYALLLLAVEHTALRPTLIATALYFATWMSLLFVQVANPEEYRYLSNLVSTPMLFIFVLSIFYNLYILRKKT